MRAWSYVDRIALEDLRQVELPDPRPGPSDVVVRMRAVALNYRDLAISRGRYHVGVSAPLVPLSDGAGEVMAVGSEVRRFAVSDLVCPNYMPGWMDGPVTPAKARRRLGGPSDGTFSEMLMLEEDAWVRAPAHLEPHEAATLPVAAVTAWHSLFEKAAVAPGATVLVNGSGGVSTSAIQLARAAGARVISVTRRIGHAGALRSVGAAEVVDGGSDFAGEVSRLAPRGVDVIVDVAAGSGVGALLPLLKPGGALHLIGYAAGTAVSFDMFDAIRRAPTIHIGSGGSRASFEALVAACEVNAIRPVVGSVHPADNWREAFAELAAGGTIGKIVLTLD